MKTDSEKMFMNPYTGLVDSYDGWWYEDETGTLVNGVDKGEVIEVELDKGTWVVK